MPGADLNFLKRHSGWQGQNLGGSSLISFQNFGNSKVEAAPATNIP